MGQAAKKRNPVVNADETLNRSIVLDELPNDEKNSRIREIPNLQAIPPRPGCENGSGAAPHGFVEFNEAEILHGLPSNNLKIEPFNQRLLLNRLLDCISGLGVDKHIPRDRISDFLE